MVRRWNCEYSFCVGGGSGAVCKKPGKASNINVFRGSIRKKSRGGGFEESNSIE